MQTTTTPALTGPSRLLKRVTIIIAVLAAAVFCAKVAQLLWVASQSFETDVGAYFSGAERLRAGLPLYPADLDISKSRELYVYPPVLALIFYPLVTYQLAWWAWAGISIACWVASLGLLIRDLVRSEFGKQLRESIWWPVFLAALINFPPVLIHLTWGQVQLPLLLLLTLAWLSLRRDRQATAGALIGLAIALKLFPLLLLAPLVVQRRWRCVAAALGVAALVLALSFAAVGWQQATFYFARVLPEVNRQNDMYDNYSVAVALKEWMGYAFPSDMAANLLRLAFLALVCLAALRRPRAADQALALGVTALFWLPPVVWSHYFVLAYLPLFDVLTRTPRRLLPSWMLAYFLIATASLLYYVPGDYMALARILPIVGALVLLGTQVAVALRAPADGMPSA